jgi:CDP-diacylglycerol--glycerol-3-phosphate 3-phosphatidyltransferase
LPIAVSVLRLVSLPFLILLIAAAKIFFADLLFILAIASDLVDGYLARRMKLSSQVGAYFDVAVDYIFCGSMFVYFVLSGIYPSWILLVITFMFLQFIITSKLTKTTFDPVGKYYGSILYGAIGLTMLLKGPTADRILLYSLLGVSIFMISSRFVYLMKKCSSRS